MTFSGYTRNSGSGGAYGTCCRESAPDTPGSALGGFTDSLRTELFDGALSPTGGEIEPDRGRPGLGLELKEADARRFAL